MDKMDKFFEIVYTNQIGTTDKGSEYLNIFKPLLTKLKATFSEELYGEFLEVISDCGSATAEYYAIEGMKLATRIMDGTYSPII